MRDIRDEGPMGPYSAGSITAGWAANRIRVPGTGDDKYSRGVVLIATGSPTYPGAAVLGCLGAARAGAGFVRYLGPDRCEDLVLGRLPEAVMDGGRRDAVVVGSGWDPSRVAVVEALAAQCATLGTPLIVDAGALRGAPEWAASGAPVILTPHHGEAKDLCKRLWPDDPVSREEIAANPVRFAEAIAERLRVVVVLKGATTVVAAPGTSPVRFDHPAAWGGTAGAGDVLAGVIGAFVAPLKLGDRRSDVGENPERSASSIQALIKGQESEVFECRVPDQTLPLLAEAAAVAVAVHGLGAALASGVLNMSLSPTKIPGHPIVASDIAEALPTVIDSLLAR